MSPSQQRARPRSTTTANGGGVGGRNKPRASQACIPCRQRKIKCVGMSANQPCNACVASESPCMLSASGDGRRIGSRDQMLAMQDRLRRLESYISESQQPNEVVAITEEVDDSAINPVLIEHQTTETLADFEHPSQTIDSASPMVSSSGSKQGRSGSASTTTTTAATNIFSMRVEMTPPSEHDYDHCLDIDKSQGQLRYYGLTSQPHVQEYEVLPSAQEHSISQSVQDSHANIDHEPLKEFLLDIFFKAQLLSTAVVNRYIFESHRKIRTRSDLYSSFLENSILACASRMSTSKDVRSMGDLFADQAKSQTHEELDKPNIASLQGFLLLSDFEATRGRDRAGYMYCGIASRLVFDLGLAESCTPLITRGKLSVSDARERHNILLATFVFDKLWSLYLGRPSAIPISMMTAAHRRMTNSGWTGTATIEAWAGLCADLSTVTDVLIRSPTPTQDTIRSLLKLDRRIQDRYEKLSTPLLLDLNHIARLAQNCYSLHVQFYGARIVLNGLVLRMVPATKTGINSRPVQDSSFVEASQVTTSRKIMCDGAVVVARLMSTYEKIYGSENMVTVMLDNMYVATAVLISYTLRWQHDHVDLPDAEAWLQALAALLLRVQIHYPVAARMRATLAKSVRGTILAGTFGTSQESMTQPTGTLGQSAFPSAGSLLPNQSRNDNDGFGFTYDDNQDIFSRPFEYQDSEERLDNDFVNLDNNIMNLVLPRLDAHHENEFVL